MITVVSVEEVVGPTRDIWRRGRIRSFTVSVGRCFEPGVPNSPNELVIAKEEYLSRFPLTYSAGQAK